MRVKSDRRRAHQTRLARERVAPELKDAAHARRRLEKDDLAFVLVREGRVIAHGTADGVSELLAAVDTLGAQARGASLADKVVGKAVALIAASAGLCAIDTPLASQAAVHVLKSHRIALEATSLVPLILNRRGDALCPLEQLTLPLRDPAIAVGMLREFFAAHRSTRHSGPG